MNEKIKQIDLSDSSIKQISDFLTSVYDDKKKFNYDYLSWLYRDNPDGEIIGFNAFDKDNNIIAHYALLPKLANFQNKNIKIALSINTATSKNAQGKGYFKKLANLSYDLARDLGIEKIIGVANQNSLNGFINSLGFKKICELEARISFLMFVKKNKSSNNSIFKLVYDQNRINWRLSNPNKKYKILNKKHQIIYTDTNIFFRLIMMIFTEQKTTVQNSYINLPKIYLWIGNSKVIQWNKFFSFNIPSFLRPAPLAFIWKDLINDQSISNDQLHFECIDFDIF